MSLDVLASWTAWTASIGQTISASTAENLLLAWSEEKLGAIIILAAYVVYLSPYMEEPSGSSSRMVLEQVGGVLGRRPVHTVGTAATRHITTGTPPAVADIGITTGRRRHEEMSPSHCTDCRRHVPAARRPFPLAGIQIQTYVCIHMLPEVSRLPVPGYRHISRCTHGGVIGGCGWISSARQCSHLTSTWIPDADGGHDCTVHRQTAVCDRKVHHNDLITRAQDHSGPATEQSEGLGLRVGHGSSEEARAVEPSASDAASHDRARHPRAVHAEGRVRPDCVRCLPDDGLPGGTDGPGCQATVLVHGGIPFELDQDVNIERFKAAWAQTLQACTALRERIVLSGGASWQAVLLKENATVETAPLAPYVSFISFTRSLNIALPKKNEAIRPKATVRPVFPVMPARSARPGADQIGGGAALACFATAHRSRGSGRPGIRETKNSPWATLHGRAGETTTVSPGQLSTGRRLLLLGAGRGRGSAGLSSRQRPAHRHRRVVIGQAAARIPLPSPKYASKRRLMLKSVAEVSPTRDGRLVEPYEFREDLPADPLRPRDVAYVLFTSETTGTPNGIVMGHRSLCTSQTAIIRRLAGEHCDRLRAPSTGQLGLPHALVRTSDQARRRPRSRAASPCWRVGRTGPASDMDRTRAPAKRLGPVLDMLLQHPTPAGCIGEVVIQGQTIVREYLARPKGTAACFLTSLLAWATTTDPECYGRSYKSGDLAHYNADGTMEFVSRRNMQTKLRGQRVEPVEIKTFVKKQLGVVVQVTVAQSSNTSGSSLMAFVCIVPQRDIVTGVPLSTFWSTVESALGTTMQSVSWEH
nr:nonribosomal peptide synthetase 12 [Quercus suber]